MNTNEKIAKWLKIKKKGVKGEKFWIRNNGLIIWIPLDFLHDRNQQKWIIQRLIELGYRIKIYICEQACEVKIWHNDDQIEVIGDNEDLDIAFISAIEQLIDKEDAL